MLAFLSFSFPYCPPSHCFWIRLIPLLHLLKNPPALAHWIHNTLLLFIWERRSVPSIRERAAQLSAGSASISLCLSSLYLCLQTCLTRAGGALIKGAGHTQQNLPTEKALEEDVILSENGGTAGRRSKFVF